MCCIVASVFVVFPAQLEAGGTQNSEMKKKKKKDLVRFCLPAKLTKPGMPGEPCCGRNIPGPQLFHPFLVVCSLLIPNHPLIPQSLSGRCTKPDPAVGAADGRIIQSLNLFHLFLWLRIVREQMAIFSSVSVIRSHSLRQRWLKQIPGPLQSHHLVFPSARPPLSAWARRPPARRRGAGARRAPGWGQPRCLHLSPLHLYGMLSSGGWQECLGSTSHLCWGLGGLGSHTAPSCAVTGAHWDSAQLQTGELLLRRRCQRLFLLHLPSWPWRKWVF